MFVVHRLFAIQVFPRATLKKNFDRPTLGTPHWPPDYKISTPELMLCKKTSAITYKKIGPVTPGSDPPPGVCSSWSRVCYCIITKMLWHESLQIKGPKCSNMVVSTVVRSNRKRQRVPILWLARSP